MTEGTSPLPIRVEETELPEVKVIEPVKHGDHRGFFSETYNARDFSDAGIDGPFVQDNHSMSAKKGVLRGIHYQIGPMAQDKLVRVVRGAILDVAVDLRQDSANFGRHVAVELNEDNWRQLWVPVGFGHGFVTLVPNTEVIYKVTNYYSPTHERGIRWDDPALKIHWGITADEVTLSEKDQVNPLLAEATELF